MSRPLALRRILAVALALASPWALLWWAQAQPRASTQIPSTRRDYFAPGSQPHGLENAIIPSVNCSGCHGYYDQTMEPYRNWAASMMAQATRDPIFHAALAIAEQDAANSGELCLRCHAPAAWLAGRATPSDGSGLDPLQGDFDGVSCNLCHRLVDPVYNANESPSEDLALLNSLPYPPQTEVHSGQMVVDPKDRRRGPFDLGSSFPYHSWLESPFHREALLCGTCHDVSNPVLERQSDGSYAPGQLDRAHPTHDKHDQYPIERTFSEWTKSVFAKAAIDTDGRFGGSKRKVATCQDCHLPDMTGTACVPGLGETRRDLPLHELAGANSWVLRAVRALYPDSETGLDAGLVDAGIARNVAMLQRAADLALFERNGEVVVRLVNRTGHKLPTGYGEGRRMWLNLRCFDANGNLLEERGHYDEASATLTQADTRVWQIEQALDDAMASLTGNQAGPSFHFVLNNAIHSDNRIPPRGYTVAGFAEVGAAVVGAQYLDEQCWDEATFALPVGTAIVSARIYHQTTTREYIEFLRDENTSNNAGQVAYQMWQQFGRSAPVLMAEATLDLAVGNCPAAVDFGLGYGADPENLPEIELSGTPSFGAGSFGLRLTRARPGMVAYLLEGDGPANEPFGGGTRLVAHGQVLGRTKVQADGSATIQRTILAGEVGLSRTYQFFFREPNVPSSIGLSHGLLLEFCP